MKKFLYIVISLFFLGVPSFAFAQDDEDTLVGTCLSFDSGGSGGSLNDHRAAMGNQARQRALTLKSLLEKMESYFKKQGKESYAMRYGLDALNKSQKLWLEYAQTQCVLEFHQGGGGTVSTNFGKACECRLISRRITNLKSVLSGYGYSDEK